VSKPQNLWVEITVRQTSEVNFLFSQKREKPVFWVLTDIRNYPSPKKKILTL
jgi:hypothetical protein